jgi:hypothetical protein
MIMTLYTDQLTILEQVEAFLTGTADIALQAPD